MIDKTLWHGCFRLLFVVILLCSGATANADLGGGYLIQPGDILRISVWKEPDLQQDLLVRPDGGVSFLGFTM
jgi:polysaccharide biosynthesis/export protein